MISYREELAESLEGLVQAGLRRELAPPRGIDFASNDYLGLSGAPEIRSRLAECLASGAPLGAPASRLLRGHFEVHARIEERFARFKGMEAALLFPSGYQANLALLSTLIQAQDRVISDQLNHASIIDGLRLARARKVIVPHRDTGAIERALRLPHFQGRTFIVTESLFSMDGTVAPLDRYAELAERYGAELIVDDAHASGLYGDRRASGLIEHFGIENRVLAALSTCGKAFGFSGAFVTGPAVVIEWLKQKARPFIFSTAVPPLLVYALDAALDILAANPRRGRRARELAARLRSALEREGIPAGGDDSPIVNVVIGGNEAAVRTGIALQEQGYDVRAVRPPSVPPGTARLRISVHADRTEEEVDGLAEALVSVLRTRSDAQRP